MRPNCCGIFIVQTLLQPNSDLALAHCDLEQGWLEAREIVYDVDRLRAEFDIILMDVQMPQMTGYEATEAIRSCERQSGRHIPIVAMTAHATMEERQRCLAAGMNDHISKPIDPVNRFETVGRFYKPAGGAVSQTVPSCDPPAGAGGS